jgi:hypothetical protein
MDIFGEVIIQPVTVEILQIQSVPNLPQLNLTILDFIMVLCAFSRNCTLNFDLCPGK